MIHLGIAGIISQSSNKSGSLILSEKAGRFGPVRNPPFCSNADDNSEEAFEDKDPI